MTRGKKFNVFMEHVTIDYPTLMKYRKILDDYIIQGNVGYLT